MEREGKCHSPVPKSPQLTPQRLPFLGIRTFCLYRLHGMAQVKGKRPAWPILFFFEEY